MDSASASPKARWAVSAAVHTPTPGSDVMACRACSIGTAGGRGASRSRASARAAQPSSVRIRPGSTLARWNSQDGMARQACADGGTRMTAGAGPGAGVPNRVTSSRQDRNASTPWTRCSSTAGMSASSTRPVRPIRRCRDRCRARCTVGSVGWKSEASSSAPSRAGRFARNSSAPSPHARHTTVSGTLRTIRAVTGPVDCRLVRQIAPTASIWKHGSPRLRRCGARVCPGLTGPGKVSVRSATGSLRGGR